MAKLNQIVVDCRHPAVLARFWSAALDGFDVLAYDDEEIARLAALGLTPETDTCVIVVGPALELCFQQVDLADVSKNPMHVDISAPDREREVERLVGLGATVEERFADHTWMLDPEGNDFCVTDERERSSWGGRRPVTRARSSAPGQARSGVGLVRLLLGRLAGSTLSEARPGASAPRRPRPATSDTLPARCHR